MTLSNILFIFIGGGIGSVLRYLLSKSLNPMFENVFIGTLTVNILGSLLIGLFVGFELKSMLSKPTTLFLITGFCGGFTTFSAFALENLNLLKSGHYIQFFAYTLASIVLGIIAVGLGFTIAKQL